MHWVRGETLGAGGFGFVSIAQTHQESGDDDLNIPAVVAVKSAKLSESKSLSKEKVLLNEFKGCPCILHCFGDQVTTENGQQLYNIRLEYAPGGCIADRIVTKGLPEHAVSRYTKSLVNALVHIHKLGYVHCDVKPHNVLLVGQDSKLADFGSCKRIGAVEDGDDEHQGGFRGTVLYAAPESIAREEYLPESDVWALGCTVLHMLTGKAPWKFGKEATAKDVLMKIGCSDDIPVIPKVASEEATDFLRKCFVKDPRARWKAQSLLDHPFLKISDRHRHRHHHHRLHLSSTLHSFLPRCFQPTAAVHAC